MLRLACINDCCQSVAPVTIVIIISISRTAISKEMVGAMDGNSKGSSSKR